MSVSGISSSNFSQYNSGVGQQIRQDFQQLGTDLQSGNLSAAQSDYATLQQALPQNNANSQTQTAQNANPIQQAFAQLSQALQSGNLSAAQQDYATIQQDAQNQQSTATHRHHHHGGGGANSAASATSADGTTTSASSNTAGDSTNSSVTSLFSELGTALQSGNLSTAQQAYTSLVQDFQQYAQQAGAFSTQTGSTGVSVTA
jgi:outer membrane protein assembly factor BamD (BamD/ComL family)